MRTINLFLVSIFITKCLSAQCNGVVQGVVLDELGKPLAGASVSLLEKGPFSGHRPIRSYVTDSEGSFRAEAEKAGTYLVVGQKESEGYPNTKLAFYSNLQAPEIRVDCRTPLLGVLVKLGPKVGRLHRISVTETMTGKPVTDAVITLRRASSEQLFISTSTTYSDIAVPPNTDIIYEISAPGFVTSSRSVLRLRPSENRNLEVKLVRLSSSGVQSP